MVSPFLKFVNNISNWYVASTAKSSLKTLQGLVRSHILAALTEGLRNIFERTIASRDWLLTFRRLLFAQAFAFILPRAGFIWTILKYWLFCLFSTRSSWGSAMKMKKKISPIELLGHLTEVLVLRLWESFFPRINVFLDEILDKVVLLTA